MKFKHTFHVFVDNFSVTYKQLLYRLIVGVIAGAICVAGVYPFIKGVLDLQSFNALTGGIADFAKSFLYGNVEKLSEISLTVREAFVQLLSDLQTRMTQIVLSGLLILLVVMIEKWFTGMGNYAAAAVINDKMALRANSPFLGTLIKNLKKAAVYNAIYVPLSIVYDLAVSIGMFALIAAMVNSFMPLYIGIFIFALVSIVAVSLKMTFTTDWLPALVRGKMKHGESIKYAFSSKNKGTMNIFSNFIVMSLLLMAVNIAAFAFTFGVGVLITIPASYVMLLSFELVNYYDREEIKYFVDKNTVIKPDKDSPLTREEFFRGGE